MVDEIAFSVAVGEVCCERCHCAAAPPASLEAMRWKPPRDTYKPPKPDEYAKLVDRVWHALKRHGEVFPLCDGSGVILGYCPSCGTGVCSIRVLGTRNEPRVRVDGCTAGCGDDQLLEALK